MKAKFVKNVTKHFLGTAILYEFEPPIEYDGSWDDKPILLPAKYVVVSAVCTYSGPETFIFPSDENGKVLSWTELEGSIVGELNIEKALSNAGYEIDN
jgi:hypothetical protein